MSDINNNIQYIDDNNIKFTEVKLPETLFTSGPLGIKGRIKKDGVQASQVVDNDKSPLINAVDIDWNGVDVGEEVLRTTGDLISWIKTKGSGGNGSGVSLNAGLTAINSSGLQRAYQAGQVLMYNGITYTWGIPSTSQQQQSINYLWAYTVAENDNAARNKLNRAQTIDVPNNYSNVPLTPPEGQFLYMTTARKQGNTYLKWDGTNVWSLPIRIGDNSTSGTGTDGDSYNYIYCLTDKNTTPTIPFNVTVDTIEGLSENQGINFISQRIDESRVNVWRDHPNGVDKDFPQEWIAVAKSEDGTWGGYSTPALWSHYGIDGKDGDTIEYIYKLTSSNTNSVTIPYPYLYEKNGITYSTEITGEDYQKDDFIPQGWSDNPLSLTTLQNRQWVSIRRGEWDDSQNKIVWGEFSTPTIWSENSVTIIDSPYVITNDNPSIQVICDYQGQSLEVNDTYEPTNFTVNRGNLNVSDDFNWGYSVNYINNNVNTPEIQVTANFYDSNNNNQDYYQIIPHQLVTDKAIITITATLKEDESFSLSTKVIAKKRKATSPGEIPQAYSLKLSQVVVLRNSEGNIINSIEIDVKDRQNNILRTYNAIQQAGLQLLIEGANSNYNVLQSNILDSNTIKNAFTNSGKTDIGDSIIVKLQSYNAISSQYEEEDFGYITLINGDIEINVDGYTFALEQNNKTISYSEELYGNGTNFDPSFLDYPIIGYKNGTPLTLTQLQNLIVDNLTCTNCSAELITSNGKLILHIIPQSTTSGGQVLISCVDEENGQICQILTATYLLETASYKIEVVRGQLQAKASSEELTELREIAERNTATITHNSRTLNSTIEAQNVFPNLFGFSNGLSFYDSEPFIQGYGLEVKTAQFTSRNFSSGVYYFNFDSSKSVIVSMNVYRGSNTEYFFGAILHGNYPSKIECNGEERSFDEGYTIRLQGGTTYKIKLYFDDISVVYDENFRNALGFHVSVPNTSTNEEINRRLYIQNLKVEYGSVATKFCISDEDAAQKNSTNLITENFVCSEGSEGTSPYQQAIYDTHSTEAIDEYPNVHCFANFEINSNSYGDAWLLQYSRDFNLMSNINKVYTFSFLAKTNIKTTNIENILYINPGASSNPRIGDYTYYNYNEALFNESNGRKVHSLDTEWKRYYTYFYISNSASGLTFLPVIKIVNDPDHSNIDYNGGGNINTRTVYITDLMLQEGYIPSEEQSFSDKFHTISQINQTASSITLSVNDQINNLSSQIEQTSTSINSSVTNQINNLTSQIQQTDSNIDLCVKKNDLIQSGITLNADGVKFTAEKVSFHGTSDNIEYIRLGRYENGLPYFEFRNPNGEVTFSLGYQGLKSHYVEATIKRYLYKTFIGESDMSAIPAQIMFNIIKNNAGNENYAPFATYYRFSAEVINGNRSDSGKAVDGLYYASGDTTTTGEVLPTGTLSANNVYLWAITERESISDSEAVGAFVVFHNGVYRDIGHLRIIKGYNWITGLVTYEYYLEYGYGADNIYELISDDGSTIDLSNPQYAWNNLA